MDDRERVILTAILEHHISTGEPVGSRTLSKVLDLGVSSATIRNIMADLTEEGYLDQPYTSAGRVPTDLAYRHYVNALPDALPLLDDDKERIEEAVSGPAPSLAIRLSNISRLLTELTRLTGVVSAPRLNKTRLKLIEFVKLDTHQVYVVLITQSNMIYHKIIEVSEDLSQEFLHSVTRYLNEQFANYRLLEIREQILERLLQEKEQYDQLLAQAVRLGKKALEISEDRNLFVEGQHNIVKGFLDTETAQRLLLVLEERLSIVEILCETMTTPGVSIGIGNELHREDLWDSALVSAAYGNGTTSLGALGVIGPTRMDYPRVIPIIDYTAKMLTNTIMQG